MVGCLFFDSLFYQMHLTKPSFCIFNRPVPSNSVPNSIGITKQKALDSTTFHDVGSQYLLHILLCPIGIPSAPRIDNHGRA